MTASARILDHFSKANGSEPIRILGASGQLGYGVPTPAFSAGLERKPHLIGCDMGSIDIGPYYLGSGELATALAATRRDLRKVLLGALKLKIPLIIGSAGSAGAKPHLEQTLAIIREIAREEGLSFRMGVLRADIERTVLKAALRSNGVVPIDGMPIRTIGVRTLDGRAEELRIGEAALLVSVTIAGGAGRYSGRRLARPAR